MRNRDMFLIDFTKKINAVEDSNQLLELVGRCKVCRYFMGEACPLYTKCPDRKALVEWLEQEVEEDDILR